MTEGPREVHPIQMFDGDARDGLKDFGPHVENLEERKREVPRPKGDAVVTSSAPTQTATDIPENENQDQLPLGSHPEHPSSLTPPPPPVLGAADGFPRNS